MGDSLLPADVSTSTKADPNENTTHVNIPPGTWYAFNSTTALTGPTPDLTYKDVPLATIVLFVRAGGILTLQRAVVQHTGAMGGDLTLQVYGGRDGSFTLTEDDGASLDYQHVGDGALRRTVFVWHDASKTLTWSVTGGFAGGPNTYTRAFPVLFVAGAAGPQAAPTQALGVAGSVTFA